MFAWAQHVAESRYVESGSSLDPRWFGLGISPIPSMLDLIVRQIDVRLDSTHDQTQVCLILQLVKPMFSWAQHVADSNDIGYEHKPLSHVCWLPPCYDYHPVIYWIFLDRGLDFFTKHQKYWLVKHIWFVLLSNSTNFQLYKMGFVLTAGVQNFVLCNLWIFSKENRMYNTICCTGSRRIVPSRIFAHHEILSSTITKDFCKFCFAQSSS